MTTRRAHAVLLLEVLVSLAILVTMSMAIGAVVGDAGDRLIRSAQRVEAEDLARSALAQIEAGIATPESLSGPVPAWDREAALVEMGDELGPRSSDEIGLDSASTEPSGWLLEIEAQPSPYEGLTLLSVRAVREDDSRINAVLHQLVRLGVEGAEGVGDLDEITERAAQGRRP